MKKEIGGAKGDDVFQCQSRFFCFGLGNIKSQINRYPYLLCVHSSNRL